jgi:hypothetical protein
MSTDPEMRTVVERIDVLLRDFEAREPEARRAAKELVRLLMRLYGAGLERIVRILELEQRRVEPLLNTLLADDLVASLLVLHELHPEDAATRIMRGLERLEADAGSHLTLVDIRDGAVVVRAEGADPSAPIDFRRVIEETVRAAAPDVESVEIDGLPSPVAAGLVQLQRRPPARLASELPRS